MPTISSGQDAWDSGDQYEQFMGRWSTLVAELFLEWLAVPRQSRWLDVGCGSGALSAVVVDHYAPAVLTAVDQSEPFIAKVRGRVGNEVRTIVGSALALPLAKGSVDVTVAGLMLNFVSRPESALMEMHRVTAQGGRVAVYIWDYTGNMEFLTAFWAAAAELDPLAAELDESRRFTDSTEAALRRQFENVGFVDVVTAPLVINTNFRDFDDYWRPFLGGQGPAPTYVQSLDENGRAKLSIALSRRLPIQHDGSIPLLARAWAAQGRI